MAISTTKPLITVDGNFSDWDASELISTPVNAVAGYSLYGTVQGDAYFIGIDATSATDLAIGAGTTIWLNTDQNTVTGYSPFGSVGADYNITYIPNALGVGGAFYLYTGAAAETFVTGPLTTALSADGKSLEIAIPRSLLTPVGGTAPTNINIADWVNNGAVYMPGDYATLPEYTITDPATLLPKTATHKVAIVYSDTTAANYFRGLGDAAGAPSTPYSDLFMAAQNQARMAGVSYDVIDESQLTDVNNLIGYDALIFPAMTNVNTLQLPAIMSALSSAVYDYHIGIITSGDFLTNDETGAALPGNPYVNMETLLGLNRVSGGNSGDVTVTANVGNPIMQSYTANQVIQTYSGVGYTDYEPVGTTPAAVLANQIVTGVGTLPGVTETTVGGTTNVHFATQALLGDSNLLSDAIQSVVLGTGAGVALHTSRQAGILAARMDMDQAQNPADVSPTKIDPVTGLPVPAGPGIYDLLIPILTQWKAQYDFVGSYYVDIGDQTSGADPTGTVWANSLPYYQQILDMGGEIGSHSYTHLINPPATTFTAHVVGDTLAGSTTITLDQVPNFYGITVGMWLAGTGIGSTTLLSGAVVHTQVTAVSGNTITISYDDDGAGPDGNLGTTGTLSDKQTLTFSIPSENSNFLEPANGTDPSPTGNPFTYAYEFGQSKADLEKELTAKLGHPVTIYGAAVPGAAEAAATSQNILTLFPSGSGYTGYVTGGWTGIESGYPSAFGYIDPTHQGSVYIAPNVTFDFTEIQYQGKSVDEALADWKAQFTALTSHAAGTPIVVWPFHDYGAADWNSTSNSPDDPLYTTQLYTSFIQQAYNAGYEFVTLEDLASRIAAQEKAHIDYTTAGNTITATVTPDPTAPDLGAMALDVVNDGTEVIQNVTGWYAYNAQELFLPRNGGSYTINLGTTQDDVTHIAALPMRGDLLSVTGDGLNLSFAMVGDGQVVVDLGNHGAITPLVSLTGGGSYTIDAANDQLDLSFTGLGEHDVSVLFLASVTAVAFSADSGASASDFVTNVAAQTISGTLNGPLGAGGVVKVSLDDGVTWQIATTAVGGMTFSLAGVTLTGSGTLKAWVENSTGASSTPFAHAYVLDQAAPLAPAVPDLIAASDSGVSSTDNITKIATPTFTGTAEVESIVTLFDGAIAVGTGIADATTGAWSVTTTFALADGPRSITAKATDLAGNVSAVSGTLPVTIDTSAPGVTGVITQPSDAVLGRDAYVTLTLNLNEAVDVDTTSGTPTLTLNNGRVATFESGSGTNSLNFGYPVSVGQHVSDLTVAAANLNGATMTDLAGNSANMIGAIANPPGSLDVEAFAVFDVTKGQSIPAIGEHYSGPVAGLGNEYINITPDKLAISVFSPNWFVHSGSGDDAIAATSGTNVLDGGTGSNFLTGGSGTDTFFVDDRGPAADIWSTVVGFHAGDGATIWGVTPEDFDLAWIDGKGAAGYTGLTLHATAADRPTASLTLAGYTQADLNNGRLSVMFGTDQASGSAYMYVHGNS
jgi:serralysin